MKAKQHLRTVARMMAPRSGSGSYLVTAVAAAVTILVAFPGREAFARRVQQGQTDGSWWSQELRLLSKPDSLHSLLAAKFSRWGLRNAAFERGEGRSALAGGGTSGRRDLLGQHFALAFDYLAQERPIHLAMLELRRALQSNPPSPAALYLLGLLNMRRLHLEEAAGSFRRLLHVSPQDAEARFWLARSLVPPFDYLPLEQDAVEQALAHLDTARQLDPAFWDPLVEQARILVRTGRAKGALDKLGRIRTFARFRFVLPYRIHLYRAWAWLRIGEVDSAFVCFNRALQLMPESERTIYRDLTTVLDPDRARHYVRLDLGAKERFWQQYWARRDPNPFTPVNERLLEHYRRVSYALHYFAFGVWPWDDRGKVYVRYGEPTIRLEPATAYGDKPLSEESWRDRYDLETLRRLDAFLAYRVGTLGGDLPATLRWFYFDLAGYSVLEFPLVRVASASQVFRFSEPEGVRGRSLRQLELLAQNMPILVYREATINTPERMDYDYEADVFNFPFIAAQFAGKSERTCLLVYYGIPTADFRDDARATESNVTLHRALVLQDNEWRPLAVRRDTLRARVSFRRTGNADLVVDALSTVVPAGSLHATFGLRVVESRKVAVYRFDLVVRPLPGQSLSLSSIVPAQVVRPGRHPRLGRSGLVIIPNPARRYRRDQPCWLYFEIYNLALDPSGRSHYRTTLTLTRLGRDRLKRRGLFSRLAGIFRGQGGRSELSLVSEAHGTSRTEYVSLQLDIRQLAPGEYDLTVRVDDLEAGETASRGTKLWVAE